jgi:g-D-glutamyl-meso-diaminopimelate peptidase
MGKNNLLRYITITRLIEEKYSYEQMISHLTQLQQAYPWIEIFTFGESEQGRLLYGIRMGTGKKRVHFNGAHHANEWLTTPALMQSIELLCQFHMGNVDLGYDGISPNLLNEVTYDIVPMVNPDGVSLILDSASFIKLYPEVLTFNLGESDFGRYKANSRGVDLNRNYNAGFIDYKKIAPHKQPSYAYYQGETFESEKEVQAMVGLVKNRAYDMVIAYHTQGEEIFWDYHEIEVPHSLKYARFFSEASGYILSQPEETAASGGFKDWFIETFKKPGYTIECGKGKNPLPPAQLGEILNCTWPIFLLAGELIRREE